MVQSAYQYVIELLRKDGTRVGQASIVVDWGTAEEWAKLVALRQERLPAAGAMGLTNIEPVWHPKIGAPYVKGVRLSITGVTPGATATELPTTYFQGLAQKAISQFVETGALEAGERVVYLAAAFPSREEPCDATSMAFTTEDATPPLALSEASFEEAASGAARVGREDAHDVPVIVPQLVLDEAASLARQAGENETGGILIGHLHRDRDTRDLFVRVTAQLPARHTEATTTRLTFTSETWTDVRAAIALRRRGEMMLGWWHSHPVRHWCKDCPAERQRVCRLRHDFFSEHDRALHRAVFNQGHSVALVVNDEVGDPTFSLFGWRRGLLETRGFGVTGASRPVLHAFASPNTQLEDEPCSQRDPAHSTLASSSSN